MATTRCSSPDDDGYRRFTEDIQVSYGSNEPSEFKIEKKILNKFKVILTDKDFFNRFETYCFKSGKCFR